MPVDIDVRQALPLVSANNEVILDLAETLLDIVVGCAHLAGVNLRPQVFILYQMNLQTLVVFELVVVEIL